MASTNKSFLSICITHKQSAYKYAYAEAEYLINFWIRILWIRLLNKLLYLKSSLSLLILSTSTGSYTVESLFLKDLLFLSSQLEKCWARPITSYSIKNCSIGVWVPDFHYYFSLCILLYFIYNHQSSKTCWTFAKYQINESFFYWYIQQETENCAGICFKSSSFWIWKLNGHTEREEGRHVCTCTQAHTNTPFISLGSIPIEHCDL